MITNRVIKFIGYICILCALQHHFMIDFTIAESIFLGLGVGLFVDWGVIANE